MDILNGNQPIPILWYTVSSDKGDWSDAYSKTINMLITPRYSLIFSFMEQVGFSGRIRGDGARFYVMPKPSQFLNTCSLRTDLKKVAL